MAVLTPVTAARSSAATLFPGVAASASGDEWANTGYEYFYAYNGTGGPKTLTLVRPNTVDGLAETASTVTVVAAPNGESMIGPFPPGLFNDGSGHAKVTYSNEGNLYVAVVKLVPEERK